MAGIPWAHRFPTTMNSRLQLCLVCFFKSANLSRVDGDQLGIRFVNRARRTLDLLHLVLSDLRVFSIGHAVAIHNEAFRPCISGLEVLIHRALYNWRPSSVKSQIR